MADAYIMRVGQQMADISPPSQKSQGGANFVTRLPADGLADFVCLQLCESR